MLLKASKKKISKIEFFCLERSSKIRMACKNLSLLSATSFGALADYT